MKPCLIYKFNPLKQKKEQEFMKNFAKMGQELESQYAKNDP